VSKFCSLAPLGDRAQKIIPYSFRCIRGEKIPTLPPGNVASISANSFGSNAKGVGTQKPLHTLRKEFGSLVNQAHGIHAASKALRHADISVINNFYTDSRARVTPGLGKLFEGKKKRKEK